MVSRIDIPEDDYMQILEVEAKTLLEHISSEMTNSDGNSVGLFLGVLIGGMFLFMLLPFGLAGLALYCALKFCLKKYRGMLPDNFV